MADILNVTNVQILYDKTIEAVRDVSITVPEGGIVALLGPNGAGKSTLLKAISNILYPEDGEVLHGSIRFEGQDLTRASADHIVRSGLIHIPEGRRLFDTMTVEENLVMGAYTRQRGEIARGLQRIYDLFPRIANRRNELAGLLSGGEQQMVAVGRALLSRPRLLMLDEPSLGLAPQVVQIIFETIVRLNKEEGLSVLFVEQNAVQALEVAHYGYVLENGRVVLDGPADKLASNRDIQEFYLGSATGGGRRSFRDVKHYKRRKRWLS